LLLIPVNNTMFLPRDWRRFFIDIIVASLVTYHHFELLAISYNTRHQAKTASSEDANTYLLFP
jgi:hypothetical protein